MSKILGLLSSYALPILATALVLTATAFGIQTWRISGLQEDRANLRVSLDSAVNANNSNIRTITALTVANERNAARYQAEKQRANEAAARADEIEARNREQADDDIDAIEQTDNDCARQLLPSDIRDRLRYAGSNGNGRSPGSNGAADPITAGTDAGL